MEQLQAQLAQLSAAQVRALLAASGHAGLAGAGDGGDGGDGASSAGDAPASGAAGEAAGLEAQRWRDEGNAHFRAGRLGEALAAYSRCVELDPGNAVGLSNRAAALLKLERYEDAARDCSAAILLAPSIKPYMRRATAYIALGRLLQAVDDLAAALNFEPSNKECASKLESIVARTSSFIADQDSANDESNRRAWIRACFVRSVCHGWEHYQVKGNPSPGALNGHALFEGPDKRIYLFGGRSVRDNKAQLYVLDNCDHSWNTVPTKGATPGSRAWHTVTLIDDSTGTLCIYGGVSSQGEDPSVYLLVPDQSPNSPQLIRWTWIKAQCAADKKHIPDARSGHTAVGLTASDTSNTNVFVFGGRTKKGVTSTMCKLSLLNRSEGLIQWELLDPQDSLLAPAPRDGHSMCEIKLRGESSSKLIVFGGNGQENCDKMNDTWVYDIERDSWKRLECTGCIPSPRSYHTAHIVERCLIIIGGRTAETEDSAIYVLDTDTCEWFEVPVPESLRLTPRAWHASALTSARSLFVMGGGTYHGPLRDSATLDLSFLMQTLEKN